MINIGGKFAVIVPLLSSIGADHDQHLVRFMHKDVQWHRKFATREAARVYAVRVLFGGAI